MRKVFQLAILALAAIGIASCGNQGENKASGSASAGAEQSKPSAAQVAEGTQGPCTVECEKFSVDIPEGWKVLNINNNENKAGLWEIGVGVEYKENLSFQYEDQANYAQERQLMMEKSGMEDLGEKEFGGNTYAAYMWHQGSDNTFKGILKIGDGSKGVVKVTGSKVENLDDEVIKKVLGSIKIK